MATSRMGKGRGRGILALKSYEPCPRPNLDHATSSDPTVRQEQTTNVPFDPKKPVNIVKPLAVPDDENTRNVLTEKNKGVQVLAKYPYRANPDRPGGFDELTVSAGEKLALLCKGHTETNNPHWWKVQNKHGEVGYVGKNYLVILEDVPSNLPWLENKRLLEEKERKEQKKSLAASGKSVFGAPESAPAVKPYQTAYGGEKTARNAAEAAKQYYCEICDKNLNGPQPYKMHMSSKGHREEMEYQGLS